MMTDEPKKEPSVPPGSLSSFPPGTPLGAVRAERDANFARTRGSLLRLQKLSSEVLSKSGEHSLDLDLIRKARTQ